MNVAEQTLCAVTVTLVKSGSANTDLQSTCSIFLILNEDIYYDLDSIIL